MVSWNLNSWQQPSEQSRAAVWSFLENELQADVGLVQEAGVPPVAAAKRVGQLIGGSRDWGTWVVGFTTEVNPVREAKGAYSTLPVELTTWRPGTAAVARIDGARLTVASLYGLQEHGYAHPAMNRTVADLSLLLDDPAHVGRLVLAGDLNMTTQWTGTQGSYRGIDGAVLDQIRAFGLADLVSDQAPGPLSGCGCDDGVACRHQQTHWQPNSTRPWQNDYLFASTELAQVVTLTVLPQADVGTLSDHAPLIADFDL